MYGDKGWAEVRGTNRLEYQPVGGDLIVEDFDPVDMCRVQLETFAAAARGETTWPVPPKDAVNGVGALEAMLKSVRADGARISV